MAAPTKNQKIESLVKLVQKRSRGAGLTAPPQRTVLETLMYAALLENAPFDKAAGAYTILENYYIDWNEIRVCSIRELADTLSDLPHPEAAAERVRRALQGIFEKTYLFDLEDLRKKGKALTDHIKFLESIAAGTPYMIHYAAQVALDGHLIPLDEAALRIMRRLGLSQLSNDGTQEICIGLDRVVLKKSSLTFAAQLHHFAAGYYDVPDSPELLEQLSAIDPDAVRRSWGAPVLTATPVQESVQEPKPELPVKKNVTPKESEKEVSAAKPSKAARSPVQSPAGKETHPATPAPKKQLDEPVVGQTPKTKVKSAAETTRKVSKTSEKAEGKASVKKSVPAKKTSKPSPAKKNANVPAKKSPTNPPKTTKAASPSKALRKQKPK